MYASSVKQIHQNNTNCFFNAEYTAKLKKKTPETRDRPQEVRNSVQTF